MPTEAPTKPPKATWRDWLIADRVPPAEIERMEEEGLLTREELLAAVNDPAEWELIEEGLVKPVTLRDLQYWESLGVVPRPIRRWHEGGSRVLYPRWFVYVVRPVRYHQSQGITLDEIAVMIRALVRFHFSQHEADKDVREHTNNFGQTPADLRLPQDAEVGLKRFASWHHRITGVEIDRVEIAVVDKNGRRHVREIPIAPRPSNRPEMRVSLRDHVANLKEWGLTYEPELLPNSQ